MKDLIKAVLDEQNWKYLESGGVIKLDVEGESSSWSSFVQTEEDQVFLYYSVLPVKVEEERLTAISGLLHKINYRIRVGGFELDLTDGQPRGQILFKTCGLLTEKLISDSPEEAKDIIRRVIAYNMLTTDYYSKTIMKAVYSGESSVDEIPEGISETVERSEQI